LGVLRILLDAKLDIDLEQLLVTAATNQPVQRAATATECYQFLIERLRGVYAERADGVSGDMLDAVLATASRSPVDIDARLKALRDFLTLPDAPNLAAANKRIGNILKKADSDAQVLVDPGLFTEGAERELHEAVGQVRPQVENFIAKRRYRDALSALTSLRSSVDAFFDRVMVMDENPARRSNRLALLRDLRALFTGVADLARLPG
jgi:glycyl-tRNA synthetase beta chain